MKSDEDCCRRSGAWDRPEPGAGPRPVRGPREPRQQGREAEVRGQAPGGGRPQSGAGPSQLGRLHAEADQHEGGPGGGQLDGDGDIGPRLNISHLADFCSWQERDEGVGC